MERLGRLLLLIALAHTTLASCKKNSDGTDTGNPVVSFTMTGASTAATVAMNVWEKMFHLFIPKVAALPPPSGMVDSAGNNVAVTQLWQTFQNVEFKFDESASSGETVEVSFVGPFTVDLLSPAPSILVSGQISTSQMRRVKIRPMRTSTLPSGAPANLLNKSIYIAGTVNGVSFDYTSPDETDIEISGPNLVTAVTDSRLLVQVNTANLIKRINLSAITSSTSINESNRVSATNPCPAINASANDLYTCFRSGLQTEANLGRDDDGDYQLESGEQSVK